MSTQANRLYVAGHGKFMVYTVAYSLKQAAETLGHDCRVPDSDDIRNFWKISGIAKMTEKEWREKFGITRQAVHYWRRKGGMDLPSRGDTAREERVNRILKVMRKNPGLSADEIAELAGSSASTVRKLAKQYDLPIARPLRMPPDEKLIELATGKTWREFADAVGLRLATIRTYVYRHPELSEKLRQVRKRADQKRYKFDLKKVKQMGQKGMSAYAIAEALKVEQMTIRAHLKRWAKESPNDFPPPYGKRLPPSSPVVGSDGGIEGQQ